MNSLNRLVRARNYTWNVRNLVRIPSTSYSTDERWMIAVKNAEKIVGYPTSFMNLRWLLTDEISNIASYISKLIGTKHPMLHVAKDLIQQNDTAKWGLIVLLISKAAEIRPEISEDEQDGSTGILHSQRSLAEITEMIKTGHQMHSTMVNVKQNDGNFQKLHFGNKLALLSGDYLYSKSFKDLALLNNNDLNEIIATSLRDMAHGDFILPRDQYDRPIPSRPILNTQEDKISDLDIGPYELDRFLGDPQQEWILRNLLGGITLLAKSCKGAMILGGHSEDLQQKAYSLGRCIGLAWQAMQELKPFLYDKSLPFTLTSAPVLFQLHSDPDMYEVLKDNNCSYREIRNRVLDGEGVGQTASLIEAFRSEANSILPYFPSNSALSAIAKLVDALTPL